jgi:hypothetical protein
MRLKRKIILEFLVALFIVGSFLFVLGYPHSAQWNCILDPCYANPNYTTWGVPVEYAGLALMIGSVALIIVLVMASLFDKEPESQGPSS